MDAHGEKIKEVKAMADNLVAGSHYASEKIQHRSDTICER